MPIVKVDREKARANIEARDWTAFDAMTDEDIARQVAENPDAAPLFDNEDFSKWRRVPARARIDVGALRHTPHGDRANLWIKLWVDPSDRGLELGEHNDPPDDPSLKDVKYLFDFA